MKYAGMPFGMWALFAGSFQKQLIAAGDGMRGMPLRLPWAATFSSGDGSRAGNI